MLTSKRPLQLQFKHAESDSEIIACFGVMQQLRPKLSNEADFLQDVRRMQKFGYRLLVAFENNIPVALAGYHEAESFVHGKFIYVEDLITTEAKRGKKVGEQLLHSIFAMAKNQGLNKVNLDTWIGNSLAQRFYYRMGMLAIGMHFSYEITTS